MLQALEAEQHLKQGQCTGTDTDGQLAGSIAGCLHNPNWRHEQVKYHATLHTLPARGQLTFG